MVQGVDGIHKKIAWLPDSDCAERAYEIESIVDRARYNPTVPIDWLVKDLNTLSRAKSDVKVMQNAASSLAVFVACFDSELYMLDVPESPAALKLELQRQFERKFGVNA